MDAFHKTPFSSRSAPKERRKLKPKMDTFYDLENETAALALQLQLSDSLELSGSYIRKGKNTQGRLTDAQLALQIYTEDLKQNATNLLDRHMTGFIGSEPLDDRTFKKKLKNLKPLRVSIPINKPGSAPLEPPGNGGESSRWASSRVETDASCVTCTACLENTPPQDTARVPCGHQYCRTCIQELFRASFMDESLFPPKCCRELITADSVRTYLTKELVRQYEDKKIEYETPNRIYCFVASCSTFIRVKNIAKEKATCPVCRRVTCTICKAKAHRGDCPADTGLQLVLATANENGWQRCYRCRRVVELEIGCNHIS